MVATLTVVMMIMKYLNTSAVDHLFWSEIRVCMAVMIEAAMAFVILPCMLGMYPNNLAQFAILGSPTAVFALSHWLVRSQATVGEVSWMKAMIPHHSIAILTNERATVNDPKAIALADGIITAQHKEIAEMKALIAALETRK